VGRFGTIYLLILREQSRHRAREQGEFMGFKMERYHAVGEMHLPARACIECGAPVVLF
jgi:hypothetical protein